MTPDTHLAQSITGLVLAGGLGRRMGGVDKGLADFRGRPMAAWVLDRLRPQVGAILINANQNADRYAAWGYPVLPDAIGGYAGPLAGLHAGLTHAATPYVLTVPCDSPYLPYDLAARLAKALAAVGARVAYAQAGGQPHPVFALVSRALLPELESYLAGGGRKIDTWFNAAGAVTCNFEDEADCFANINTAQELERLAQQGEQQQ
ncbi:MAG: molybdenum cofactor guanylyltransferase [Rhodocyclaceae bacterium]|nr:molybdenum cofactor guanylyltransferase [Rhodocyclaceae bacterium]MBX3667012.1 molybdenum cofactor guanylyltransferase [Rhodocyclaceae bacterium]